LGDQYLQGYAFAHGSWLCEWHQRSRDAADYGLASEARARCSSPPPHCFGKKGPASVVYGGRREADAEAEGKLTLTGDRQLFDRFVTWFPLPEKIG
jgi:hypothetical protein